MRSRRPPACRPTSSRLSCQSFFARSSSSSGASVLGSGYGHGHYNEDMELTNIRSIAPPVSNLQVFSSTNALPRRRKSRLNYAKANQRWWVGVRFNSEIDVMMFEKTIEGSPISLVEFGGEFYIQDPRIADSATMDAPFRYAKEELPRLNAAVKLLCPQYVPARFKCGVELFPEGHGQGIVSVDAFLHGANGRSAIIDFLEGPETVFPAVLDLCSRNADVGEALFYFGADGNTWANLYKICEIIQDYCGGKKELLDRGWCSRSNLERFNRTANHQEAIGLFSRHARARAVPPPDPMTVEEARGFTRELLDRWIHELLN